MSFQPSPYSAGDAYGDMGAFGGGNVGAKRLIHQVNHQIRQHQRHIGRLQRGPHILPKAARAKKIMQLEKELRVLYHKRAQLMRQLVAKPPKKHKGAYRPAPLGPAGETYEEIDTQELTPFDPPTPAGVNAFRPSGPTPGGRLSAALDEETMSADVSAGGSLTLPAEPWYKSPFVIGGVLLVGAVLLFSRSKGAKSGGGSAPARVTFAAPRSTKIARRAA